MRLFRHSRTPACTCTCGTLLDAATNPRGGNQTPTPGDYSVCIECARVWRFGDDLALVELTVDELAAMSADDRKQIVRIQRVVATRRPS